MAILDEAIVQLQALKRAEEEGLGHVPSSASVRNGLQETVNVLGGETFRPLPLIPVLTLVLTRIYYYSDYFVSHQAATVAPDDHESMHDIFPNSTERYVNEQDVSDLFILIVFGI